MLVGMFKLGQNSSVTAICQFDVYKSNSLLFSALEQATNCESENAGDSVNMDIVLLGMIIISHGGTGGGKKVTTVFICV